ncbi:MAG: hypothetical protein Q8R79_02970 [Legionellaceae bacterium]|nr:hypothetical protein [Legionellaceae bacterium]
MSSFEQMELKKADYSFWNNVLLVTLNEFIYLAAGYEPLDVGAHNNAYLNLTNNDFKAFYKKIKRLGEELSWKTTKETKVSEGFGLDAKYEAVYLIKWALSKGITVYSIYRPAKSDARERSDLLNQFIDRDILSRNEFSRLLSAFNPGKDEAFFQKRITEAVILDLFRPISATQDCNYDIPLEDRNYQFTLINLIKYAKGKEWTLPNEILRKVEVRDQDQKPQDPRCINSAEKLYLGLAIELGYSPTNSVNTTTGSNKNGFSSRLDTHGLKLSDDKIRVMLRNAAEKHLENKPNKA